MTTPTREQVVQFDVFSKHNRIFFSVGTQSFMLAYEPEDEPEMSAGQQAEWFMYQVRGALSKLARADLEAKVAELDSVIAEQASELAKRQDQIVIDERVIAELEADIANLHDQLEEPQITNDLFLIEQAKVSALEEEKRKLIEAVADHVTVRSEQHSRIVELEAEVARLNGIIDSNIDDGIDKILAMTDEQINALAGLEGRNPEDQATIARKCMEVATLNVDISQLRQQLAASQAREKGLRDAVEAWKGIAENCSIEAGYCCCGDDMKNHASPMLCGHSPVDMADGPVSKAIELAHKALSTTTDDTALREYCAGVVEKIAQLIQPEDSYQDDWFKAKADCYQRVMDAADKIRKGEAL